MRSPFASIISWIKKGAAPATSGMSIARAMTSGYSSKSPPYFITSTWAFTPSTRSRNSSSKPAAIDMTASSAATPSATPEMATMPITLTVRDLRARR